MLDTLVILAAGSSSRCYPFNTTHKSTISLMGKPLMRWLLESLTQLKLKKVVIVVGPESELPTLINPHPWPFTVQFIEQPQPNGAGDALIRCLDHISDCCGVLNAYHLNANHLLSVFDQADPTQVTLTYRSTQEPQLYGIIEMDAQHTVTNLVEKPQNWTKAALRLVGVYQLTRDFIASMQHLPPEEYLLETALGNYSKTHTVKALPLELDTLTLKYPWHILDVFHQLYIQQPPHISNQATISPLAFVEPTVSIATGVTIHPFACLKGNTYIGPNTLIGDHAVIRDSHIGTNCKIGVHSDIARSVFLDHSTSHGGGFIGDSVVGEHAKLAAGVITANRRFDRQEITALVKNKPTQTGKTSLGAIIGNHCSVGVGVCFMPNVIIGNKVTIEPGAIISKNRPE